jgi:hypothetical protein
MVWSAFLKVTLGFRVPTFLNDRMAYMLVSVHDAHTDMRAKKVTWAG